MCPLRIILIFLSATLAGFFVLKNFKSQSQVDVTDDSPRDSSVGSLSESSTLPHDSAGRSSRVISAAIGTGFWTCVDMASGRYLWRHLASSSKRSSD